MAQPATQTHGHTGRAELAIGRDQHFIFDIALARHRRALGTVKEQIL